MKIQPNNYSCGVYAVINAARCYGIILSVEEVEKYSKTTRKLGTNQRGILRALKKNGMIGKEITYQSLQKNLNKVRKNLFAGKPIIVYLENEEHWCVLVGMLGDKFVLFDSDKAYDNIKENGTYILSEEELLKYWVAKDGTKHPFYGISVKKLSNEN